MRDDVRATYRSSSRARSDTRPAPAASPPSFEQRFRRAFAYHLPILTIGALKLHEFRTST
jgi:hypothetical protein